MTEDRWQNVFRPDLYPNLDTRTRHPMAETRDLKEIPPANHPVPGFPLSSVALASGRAAIAMAAVRRGTYESPGRLLGYSNLRPPTDATPSRPYLDAQANHPVSGFPLSAVSCLG